MTSTKPVDRIRAFRTAGALLGLAVMLGACNHTADQVTTASIPDDYRARHPIAVQEANQSVVIFVGHARGGLSAPQRADVMGLAQTWLHEATGPIVADVPVDTPRSAKCSPCWPPPAYRRAASSSTATIRAIRARWPRSG
jgi:pilus assembly protein CpaD